MVEGADRKLKLVAVVNHGLEVRHRVAVRVDVDVSAQRRRQRLPLDVLREVLVHVLDANGLGFPAPVVLPRHQIPGRLERAAKLVALAHAAVRRLALAAVHALGVFAARHLHVAPVTVRVREHVVGGDFAAAVGLAHGVLDDKGLAAHVVAGAGQDERGGDAAGLDDLDLHVVGVDGVDGARPRRDVARYFIRVLVAGEAGERAHAGVTVHVDDAAGEQAAAGVDDEGVLGEGAGRDGVLDLLDQAVLEVDVARDPFPAFTRTGVGLAGALDGLADPDGGVLDESRLAAVDVPRIALAAKANRVLRLGVKLLAYLQVGVELGDGQLGCCALRVPRLLPLGEDDEGETGDGE